MTRRKRNRKWLWGALILVVLIVAVVIGVLIWKNSQNNTSDANADGEDGIVRVEDKKDKTSDSGNSSENAVDEKKVVQYEGEDPNDAEELSGAVTYAGVVDETLMVRLNIDQYVSNGKCELSLVRNGNSIYSSFANVIADVSTSTCEGFDISTNGLGSGNTEIIIKVSADGKTGTIYGEVNI